MLIAHNLRRCKEHTSGDTERERQLLFKRLEAGFFSVRRLLGSRQVVTQRLCQLNELASCIVSSLGVSKESIDPQSKILSFFPRVWP